MKSFPFRSNVSRFVNSNTYIQEIEETLFILIIRMGTYLQIEISEEYKVCESFISHISRLVERIYSNTLLQGEPQRMDPEVQPMYIQHSPFIITLFQTLFPHVTLSRVEIYYLVLYFCRLKKEVGNLNI